MNEPLWFQNLAAYSLQLAVVALVGSLLPYLLKLRAPRIMLAYWQALLGTCLVLPAVQPWQPAPASMVRMSTADSVVWSASASGTRLAPFQHPLAFPIFTIVAGILVAGVLVRLAWLAIGLYGLSRCRHRAQVPISSPEVVRELAARLGVASVFGISTDIKNPVTFGWRRPVILLPRELGALRPAAQQTVVCHELVPIRRRDWLLNIGLELIRALVWFHPAIWWLTRRIRLCCEQVVDREVVELTGARDAYFEALLAMTVTEGRARPRVAPLLLKERQLAARMAILLTHQPVSKPRVAASLGVIVALLLSGGRQAVRAFPLRAAPALNSGEGQTASQNGAVQPKITFRTDPDLKPLQMVPPKYPDEARRERLTGEVVLVATVDEKGRVSDLKAQGLPVFVKAAEDAVRQWRYAPSSRLSATLTIAFEFDLPDPEMEALGKLERAAGDHKPYRMEMISGRSDLYPEQAKAQHIQGEVALEVTADDQRRVTDVRVIKSDNEILSDAAVKMCRQPSAYYNGTRAELREMARYWNYWNPGVNRVVMDFELEPEFWKPDGRPPMPGFVTQAPRNLIVMHRAFATYPDEAKEEHVQGEVAVQLTVGATGEVSDARVVSGPEPLHDAALEAAGQWRFFPPRTWPVNVTLTYEFRIID